MIRCDTQLQQAMAALRAPLGAFDNPLTSRIGSLSQAGLSAKAKLAQELANPVRPPGLTDQEWNARLASMDSLTDLFTDFMGNGVELTVQSKLHQFKSFTDWQSGAGGIGAVFPSSVLSGMGSGVSDKAALALLGTATFATMMSVAGNSKLADFQKTCQSDDLFGLPQIPLPQACAGTNNMFAMLLGGYNAGLDAMNSAFAGITTFMNMTAQNLQALQNQINGMIDDMVARVVGVMGKIADKLMTALQTGLAHLMKNMALDPCTSAILGQIGRPALRSALNITDPAALLGSMGTIPSGL